MSFDENRLQLLHPFDERFQLVAQFRPFFMVGFRFNGLVDIGGLVADSLYRCFYAIGLRLGKRTRYDGLVEVSCIDGYRHGLRFDIYMAKFAIRIIIGTPHVKRGVEERFL